MNRLLRAFRQHWSSRAERRSMLRGMWSVAVVLGAGWLIVMPGGPGTADAFGSGVPRVGQEAPDFTTETLTDTPFTLSSARGRPVWINFWASWCPPCRAEMPDIEAVRADAGERLEFIALNLEEPRNAIVSYMSKAGYDFPVGVDPEGLVSGRYRVLGLPTHIFIAADGSVAAIRVGGMTRTAMSETVNALIAGEAPPQPGRSAAKARTGDADLVRLGAAIYNAQCLLCHGDTDGTGGVPEAPRHTNDGHTWHHSDLQLTAIVMRGSGERQAMPAFGDRLKPDEVRAVLAYIKTWWGDEQRASQAQATRDRDRGRQ